MYYLMIKTHNIIDMNYLCITKRKDWKNYTGSGVYWNAILKKYGSLFNTMLLYNSNDYTDFLEVTQFYSKLFDVANNKNFANIIPENGYDNGNYGKPNVEIFWEYVDDVRKKEIITRRAKTITDNHWTKKEGSEIICKKISEKKLIYWSNIPLESRIEYTAPIREKAKLFFKDKESEKYITYCLNQKINSTNYMNNLSLDERKIMSDKISQSRINLSPDKKNQRKLKIQEAYASGKHDYLFEKMSVERLGLGNPNAKIVLWFGKEYTLQDFKIFCKKNKLSKEYINEMFLTNREKCVYPQYEDKHYDIIICPHCKKESNKKPSSFKRWHFDNCKFKGLNNESK